ncbi:hypothetical protein AB4K20DRAFT_1868219 [Rhizopus microsporus]
MPQLHVLRQGGPLSPLLFSLAFEPLLCTILANNQLRSVSLHSVPVPLMLMTWRCFSPICLNGPYLLDLLSLYDCAFNAKVNLNKNVIMSLSGRSYPEWIFIAQCSLGLPALFFSTPAGCPCGHCQIEYNSACSSVKRSTSDHTRHMSSGQLFVTLPTVASPMCHFCTWTMA